MRGAKIGGRVFRTVKRPELRGVAVAAEDEVGASGSTIFTLAVLASSLNSWPLLGSMASWTWRASCNLSSEEARPPRAATSPTFTGSLSLDLARLLANFNILSQSHFTAPPPPPRSLHSATKHAAAPGRESLSSEVLSLRRSCGHWRVLCCPGMPSPPPPPATAATVPPSSAALPVVEEGPAILPSQVVKKVG